MNFLTSRFLLFVGLAFVLVGCSPHPGTGVWKATAENEMGIERLVVGFEGRAEFVSKKIDNASWHCFWGKESKTELSFDCTPSTNPDMKRTFVLTAAEPGTAKLHEVAKDGSNKDNSLIATFTRLDENPSPKK